MNRTIDHSFRGSERKFLLEITAPGFSMHDDNFTVTLKQNTIVKEFQKADIIEESYTDEGTEITVMISGEDAGRLARNYGSEFIKETGKEVGG